MVYYEGESCHGGALLQQTRLEWVASTLRVTFVDPNCWVDDWDYSGDGLHINRRGARHLEQLYSRICEVGSSGQGARSQ